MLACVSCDEALRVLREHGICEETLRRLTGRVELHLANRAGEQLRTGAILFSKAFGLLGETGQAPALLQHIREG